MKRRRTADVAIATAATNTEQAPSPDASRSRRAKRSTSNPPSKTSRPQPSTPLRMTTRRAASRAATHSTANSIASADSRRSSLASVNNVANELNEPDEEPPAKRTRHSTKSSSSANSRTAEKPDLIEQNGVDVPDNSSQDSTQSCRSRKRPAEDVVNSIEAEIKDDEDSLQVNEEAKQDLGEATPAKGRPDPGFPLKVAKRGRRPRLGQFGTRTPATMTPIGSAMASPLLAAQDMNDADLGSNDQGPEKPVKRLPGRRRAPHADVNIEADLRRQLNLKMAYRAVAKLQKLALAELSRRSLEEIENDPESHKKTEQYHVVQGEINRQLEKRLSVLEHSWRLQKKNVENKIQWDKEVQEQIYRSSVRDLQEEYRIRAKHKLLRLLREICAKKKQLEESERTAIPESIDEEATEDEGDGVIPALTVPTTNWSPRHLLDERYDSRSRFYVLTERAWDKTADRLNFAKERQKFLDEDEEGVDAASVDGVDKFASYDSQIYKIQGLLSAVNVAADQTHDVEQYIADTSSRVDNGLEVLAGLAEDQQQKPAPVTPAARSRRGTHSKQTPTENVKPTADETTASVPASSRKRRSSRASRTRESSPIKQAPPATPDAAVVERTQTPRAAGNKIADLLNQDPPLPLPAISEVVGKTVNPSENVERRVAPFSQPPNNASLPPIHQFTEQQVLSRQEKMIDGIPREQEHFSRPEDASREASLKHGRKAVGGSFWSRLAAGSREQSTESDHRHQEGSTTGSYASRRRQSSPPTSRPSLERLHDRRSPPPIDTHGSVMHLKYNSGSNSAVESPASTSMRSPTFHHNRGYSTGHKSRPSLDDDAARRASIAVPPQYSNPDRRPHHRASDPQSSLYHQPAAHSRAVSYDRAATSEPWRHSYSGPSGPPPPVFLPPGPHNSHYGPTPPYQNGYIPGTGSFWPQGPPPPSGMPPPLHQQPPYGPPPPEHGYAPYPPHYGPPAYGPLPPPGSYQHGPPPPHFHYGGQPIAPAQSPPVPPPPGYGNQPEHQHHPDERGYRLPPYGSGRGDKKRNGENHGGYNGADRFRQWDARGGNGRS